MARGSFRLSICRGSGGGGGGRRNNGRKDSSNYWEERRVAMKNGTEGGLFYKQEWHHVLQGERVRVVPGWQGRHPCSLLGLDIDGAVGAEVFN